MAANRKGSFGETTGCHNSQLQVNTPPMMDLYSHMLLLKILELGSISKYEWSV